MAKPNLLARWKAIFQSRPKTSTINHHPPISDVYSLMRENHIPDSWFISSLRLQINGRPRLETIASFLHLLRNWAGVCNNICLSLIFRWDVSGCTQKWVSYMQRVYYMMWRRRCDAFTRTWTGRWMWRRARVNKLSKHIHCSSGTLSTAWCRLLNYTSDGKFISKPNPINSPNIHICGQS